MRGGAQAGATASLRMPLQNSAYGHEKCLVRALPCGVLSSANASRRGKPILPREYRGGRAGTVFLFHFAYVLRHTLVQPRTATVYPLPSTRSLVTGAYLPRLSCGARRYLKMRILHVPLGRPPQPQTRPEHETAISGVFLCLRRFLGVRSEECPAVH
jgi:hypothetical protein